MLGAGVLLAGCRSKGPLEQASLPGPIWPTDPGAKGATLPGPSGPIETTGDGFPDSSDIIPRSAWATGGLRGSGEKHMMNGVRRITIHHTAMDATGLDTRPEVAKMLDNIRKEHMRRDSRVIDIGYHYIVDPSGQVWAGRSTDLQGAHVKDQNEHNLGICFMGNFEYQHPTRAQIRTLNTFVPAQMQRFNVHTANLFTHRELGLSACPGANLQSIMVAARSRSGQFAMM